MVHVAPTNPIRSPLASSITGVCITLADVIARLDADPHLSPRERTDMLSALHTVGRLCRMEPGNIPAQPKSLRPLLAAVSPAAAGISAGRFNNVRSLTLQALKQAGIRTMRGRTDQLLLPGWETLRAQLPDAKARYGLSRFMSICSEQMLAPESVTAETFAQFQQALDADSLAKAPGTTFRTTCALWNRAAATIAGWPALTVPVPDRSRRYALHWAAFPASFRADADAFLTRSGNQDPFADDYAPSAKSSTLRMRHKQILQLATALAAAGHPIDRITGLAVLVDLANAKLALRFFLTRAGGQPTKYLHQHALLLKTLARHWVKAPPDQVMALSDFCQRLTPKHTGMTDKNRARLRQFDNPANVQALLTLPVRVLREVSQNDTGRRREALRVMLALAVELLTVAPVRIANLAGLEVERHFVRISRDGTSTVHLVIPACETKNATPYEMALPQETAAFLARYLATYHPRLSSAPSRWLFPNEAGSRRHITMFATEVSRFVLRETGIRMNVHLFRHLAAKLHLEACPEDIETARQILGHKSATTTLRCYAEVKTASAFRRYDNLIRSLREQTAVPVRGRRKTTGDRS